MEHDMQARANQLKQLQAEGRFQEAQTLQEELRARLAQYQKIKAAMTQHMQMVQNQSLAQGSAQLAGSSGTTPAGVVTQPPAHALPGSLAAGSSDIPAGGGPPLLHRRTPSNSQLNAGAITGSTQVPLGNSQMIVAQMQKMLESAQHRQASGSQPQATLPAPTPSQLQGDPTRTWRGTLSWTGMDGPTKKELLAEVTGSSNNPNMSVTLSS
jgi:hypothetical protein